MKMQERTSMTQFDFKGRVIKSFAADATDPINAICVSPEDAYLAGCIKEKIYLWNCETGVSYGKLEGHHANITCCFMNDELLASGSENGIVHLWKYKMLKRVARIGVANQLINTIALSHDGQYLAIGLSYAKPRVYTISTDDSPSLLQGPAYRELCGHSDVVTGIKFSPNGFNMITSSKDGTVRIWSTSSGECIQVIRPEDGEIKSASYCGSTNDLLFASTNGFSVWNLKENILDWKQDGEFMFASSSHITKAIATITPNGRLNCYNSESKKEIVKKGTAHTDDILSCIVSSNGTNFLTSGADGKLFLWD